MKVLLVNGSSREHGCTDRALREVAAALNKEGIDTEFFFIGNAPIPDCTACGSCRKTGKCVFGDVANRLAEKALECDGFVFGSPVYYAHPSARLLTVLDRAFYSCGRNFAFTPGAAVVSARRSGTTASVEVINKYFGITSMPIVSSTYWNAVHGNTPAEVEQDTEGLATMTNIGHNMAWMLRCIEAGKAAGITPHEPKRERTSFIR